MTLHAMPARWFPRVPVPEVSEEYLDALERLRRYNTVRARRGLPLLDVNGNEYIRTPEVGAPGQRPASQWTAIGGLVI